jgi:hypothetical protein
VISEKKIEHQLKFWFYIFSFFCGDPTTQPSPPTVDDPIVAAQDKSNDKIRIGPITRARAKLLQ